MRLETRTTHKGRDGHNVKTVTVTVWNSLRGSPLTNPPPQAAAVGPNHLQKLQEVLVRSTDRQCRCVFDSYSTAARSIPFSGTLHVG